MVVPMLPVMFIVLLWVWAFTDCLGTPESEVRNLPKAIWALIVLVFGIVLVGTVAWALFGRPRRYANGRTSGPMYGTAPGVSPSAPSGPSHAARPEATITQAPVRQIPPDDNPEFLAELAERIRREREERDGRDGRDGGDTV